MATTAAMMPCCSSHHHHYCGVETPRQNPGAVSTETHHGKIGNINDAATTDAVNTRMKPSGLSQCQGRLTPLSARFEQQFLMIWHWQQEEPTRQQSPWKTQQHPTPWWLSSMIHATDKDAAISNSRTDQNNAIETTRSKQRDQNNATTNKRFNGRCRRESPISDSLQYSTDAVNTNHQSAIPCTAQKWHCKC